MLHYSLPIASAKTFTPIPLTYDQRLKSRMLLQLQNQENASIFLPRGMRLQTGTFIQADDGSVLHIVSAPEEISLVSAEGLELARACYHLGNRHIPVAITAHDVCYLRDEVIDDMMKGLRFAVFHRTGAFEPESGAYASHSHGERQSS